jgi:hypothetical protein
MPQKPTCYISYARDAEILNFLVRLKTEIEKSLKISEVNPKV